MLHPNLTPTLTLILKLALTLTLTLTINQALALAPNPNPTLNLNLNPDLLLPPPGVQSLHNYLEQVGHPEGNHIDVLRWCAVATT